MNTNNFITVEGKNFMLKGKPYYFLGTNLWYGCYIGSTYEFSDRDRLIRELDHLELMGINNLRILGASESSRMKNSLKPAIQTEPGIYDEKLLEGLDFLLHEMSKRNMYAVIFLNNYWEWSGGMQQYNGWFSDNTDQPLEITDWGEFMQYSARFYFNDSAQIAARKYMDHIINRKNTINGILYKNDPAIMAWELANEPRPGHHGAETRQNLPAFYKWIENTSEYIRQIDTNHLISTGSEGIMGCISDNDVFIKAHSVKYIDYASFHLWPKNWSFLDAKDIDKTLPESYEKVKDYIDNNISLMVQLNKPIVLGEFGVPRDNEDFNPGSPVKARDELYSYIFEIIYKNAKEGKHIAGCNFWTWSGEGRACNKDFWWRPGDTFTGDPPQEEQGLNSVFNTDTSTISIIKKYTDKMNSLH